MVKLIMKNLSFVLFVVFMLLMSNEYAISAKWSKIKGPSGGGIERMLSKDSVLFGIRNNALYSSTNDGDSWQLQIDTNLQKNVFLLEKDFVGNLYIYAGQRGIFKSVDNGNNWYKIWSELDTLTIESICFPNQKTILLGLNFKRFAKSVNNGDSWKLSEGPAMSIYSFYLTSGKYIYAKGCNENGYVILKSSDFGDSWTSCDTTHFQKNYMTCFSINSKGWLFAGAYNGLFYSDNEGMNWTKIENSLKITSVQSLVSTKDSLMYLTDNGSRIFISSDYGITWSLFEKDPDFYPIRFVEPIEKNIIYVSGSLGLYRSLDNLKTWIKSFEGLELESFSRILCFEDKLLVNSNLITYLYDIKKEIWSDKKKGASFELISYSPNGTVHLSSSRAGYYRSTDNGETLEQLYSNYITGVKRFLYLGSGDIYAVCVSKISKSTDNGTTWDYLQKPNSNLPSIIDGCFDKSSNIIIAATDSSIYKLSLSDSVMKKYDLKFNEFFQCIFANSDNSVLLGDEKGIIKVSSDFQTYRRVFSDNDRIMNIKTDKIGNIYAFTSSKILRSFDGGENWQVFENIFHYSLAEIDFDEHNRLYAATFDSGILVNEENVSIPEEQPTTNIFDQFIYPNPATDFIEISVGAQGSVPNTDIRILNVFGEIVSTSVCSADTSASGGQRIDVSGLPSGVYFVRFGDNLSKFVKI